MRLNDFAIGGPEFHSSIHSGEPADAPRWAIPYRRHTSHIFRSFRCISSTNIAVSSIGPLAFQGISSVHRPPDPLPKVST